ncbi:MAG: peptide ABC transporter substrate-binding protein [Planctomycetota bacterium]|nr:peptide ABC transporter substrate-binding protein [Planctomycetota bacterium]
MYRNLLGIGAVLLLALVLVGITFSASTERPADFRFINGTEPKTLDPHIMTGQPEGRIADAIFEGVTYRDPETLAPVPGCATHWDISADGKTYTFHMRKEARWSDGTPITAHDFVYSWKRLQEPKLGSEYAYIMHMLKWAQEYNTYESHAKKLIGPLTEKDKTPVADMVQAAMVEVSDAGMSAKAWQTLLEKGEARNALKDVTHPVVLEALARDEGTLTAAELQSYEAALREEGQRRRDRAALARKHFGVDQGVYATDDYTLVAELKAPTPYFLEITSFYSARPVPRHVVEIPGKTDEWVDDWFLPHKIVTNGAFHLEQWRVNEKIRLVRSETYWGKDTIRLGVVDAFPYANQTLALNLYLTGGAEWCPDYPRDLVQILKKRPDFRKYPGMVVYYYRFNHTRKPFNDVRVRRAISLAIDRKAIVEHVTKLGEQPAYLFVPPGMPGYEPPPTNLEMNVEEARRLMAEAGYPGGKGLKEIGILYNTNESHRKIAEAIADQLRKNLGIKIKAYNQEWQAYQDTTRKLDYDMARAGWIGDYQDPKTFLDMWVTKGGNNQTGYSSAAYDSLIRYAANVYAFMDVADEWLPKLKERERAQSKLDAVKNAETPETRVAALADLRMHLLREAEAILVQDDYPIMPIYFYVVSSLVSEKVGGFVENRQDIHPIRGMWMKDADGGSR